MQPDHRFALTLEYDGGAFSGWQRQPGRRTVEGALLTAIATVTGETPSLTAAGRTDAGAHAHGQVVGLSLRLPWDAARLLEAINAVLPPDVSVVELTPAPPGFHARFDAIARTYRYVIAPRPRRAVGRQYAWLVRGGVDVALMRSAARVLVGRHDFAAFGRSPRPGGTTRRSVSSVDVRRLAVGDAVDACARGADPAERSVVVIDVTADAFLRGMMRAIAGALVAVGSGRLTLAELASMVDAPTVAPVRRPAVAPAHGLHQWHVSYAAVGASASETS